MKKFLDYEIIEKIGESRKSIVYRARLENRSVVIKILRTEYSSPSDIARLKHEYKIIKGLDLDGILSIYDIVDEGYRVALILEDFEARSLKELAAERRNRGISIREFLDMGIRLSEIIGNLHKNNIIHRDIKPHNILVNTNTGELKLADFGIASEMTHENEAIYDRAVITGTLVYMSPEQTGRMNRSVDYRSDLYSLGITFYEMLTGNVPFQATDPLEIIHAHMAKNAVPPAEVDAGIPGIISDIVMKLISKTVEERYQNAFGLAADLGECRNRLREEKGPGGDTAVIEPFEPGKNDISLTFSISRKLFGREDETRQLLAAFERVCSSSEVSKGLEIMLVAGAPGIGKSALIQEIHKPIVAQKGYFISGKYEQYGKDVPYSALIQAYRGLARHILSESREMIAAWKEKLEAALGGSGQVIIDVIPEVELIVGKQPDVPVLGFEESNNRFNIVFKNFTEVFAKQEHPLVLFIDDLQWADIGGLTLIENIVTDPNIESFFFIGAYRDTEVMPGHPLINIVKTIERCEIPLTEILLSPLTVTDVSSIIRDVTHCDAARSLSLAELVHNKTGGNPFFVNRFLTTLYEEKLLSLNPATGWQWDIHKISSVQMTDNVVDLMAGKIKSLSGTTREVLKIAACIGSRFNLETISITLVKSIDMVLDDLREAVTEELVTVSGDWYNFQHDKIQEAAYSLIREEDKKELHHTIGTLLLEKTAGNDLNVNIFDIVGHLNLSRELLSTPEERSKLAGLNCMAGKKAKASSAFDTAYQYFKQGVELLPSGSWEKDYTLTSELYTECGETGALSGDYAEADRFFDIVIEKGKNVLDVAHVYERKILLYTNWPRRHEVLDLGREALALLGFHMPKKGGRIPVLKEIIRIKLGMGKRKIKDLIDLDECTDPYILAISRILMICVTTTHTSPGRYFPIIALKLFNLILQHGNSVNAAEVYVIYGTFLSGTVSNFTEGYEAGRLALKAIERFNEREAKAMVLSLFAAFISSWKSHIKESSEYFQESYRLGIETGDSTYASYSIIHYLVSLFFRGEGLPELEEKFFSLYNVMKKLHRLDSIPTFELWYQLVVILHNEPMDTVNISGEIFEEEDEVPLLIRHERLYVLVWYIIGKQILSYLSHSFEKAVEVSEYGKQFADEITDVFGIPRYYFYYSLSLLAVYRDKNRSNRKEILKQVHLFQKKMNIWMNTCPENFLHLFLLVQAELARVTGKPQKDENGVRRGAIRLFDSAIDHAHNNGYLQDEALAYECAAAFYREMQYDDIALHYLVGAHTCYSRWGAKGKVKQLEAVYPELFSHKRAQGSADTVHDSLQTSATESLSEALDLSTVIKSSQALSGEIELDKLLVKLMNLTLENAGAQKGFMILEHEGKFFVEAEGEMGTEAVRVLESIPVEKHPLLPAAIINYTIRTGEPLILNDAANAGDFTGDPFIMEFKPKSILCMPIKSQGKLTGILYLKNNLITDVFTPERLEILKVITAQVAISIDNSRLYEDLKRKNSRLIELDKMKDEFLANTSHELRTPLNGIIGLADSMLEKGEDSLDEESRTNLSLVVSSGRRLASLINDILDFSRLKTKDIELSVEPLDMRTITDGVLLLLKPLTGGKDLELVNAVEAGTPPVLANEERLRQILFNLVGNAIKFTESGSVTVGAEPVNSLLDITVSDTGIGIPEEKFESIFESFEQGDGSISREYGGTGIGLSIVKQLVELHRGTIVVNSVPGQGSEFLFTLPIAEKQAVPEKFSPAPAEISGRINNLVAPKTAFAAGTVKPLVSGKTRGNILAVDDDPVNLRVIRNYLTHENYSLTFASNGTEALDLVWNTGSNPGFDLVLLDIMMPGISGYDVCRILREDLSLYDLPVLMLTAKNTLSDMLIGFQSGANDYLTKPLNKEELLVRVDTLVKLKRTVKDNKEAKFKLLQDRMNPHFLFNALNTIHALMRKDVTTANEALMKLAHNYRFLMDQVLKSVIGFDEEWEFVKNYLELEELQFDDTLSIEMNKEGDFSEIVIPPLTIQPLVENSLKHGLRNKSGSGFIEVTAVRRDDEVRVRVIDDGVGLQKEDIMARSLGNIKQRLQYFFESAELT
ncbi:MAG: AAA family ATPase, partial [bacterium]|nr:AAA family ATPase [bacterium]